MLFIKQALWIDRRYCIDINILNYIYSKFILQHGYFLVLLQIYCNNRNALQSILGSRYASFRCHVLLLHSIHAFPIKEERYKIEKSLLINLIEETRPFLLESQLECLYTRIDLWSLKISWNQLYYDNKVISLVTFYLPLYRNSCLNLSSLQTKLLTAGFLF